MADDSGGPAADASSAGRPTLVQTLQALLAELPGLVSDRVTLLSLELQRASEALGRIVGMGLLAAILAATAWLALWVGLAAAMIRAGLDWPWACLVVTVVNLAGAGWAAVQVRALLPRLSLPATLRQLTSVKPDREADPASAPPSST